MTQSLTSVFLMMQSDLSFQLRSELEELNGVAFSSSGFDGCILLRSAQKILQTWAFQDCVYDPQVNLPGGFCLI